MKKTAAIVLALVLTAGMLTACRKMPDESTVIPTMTDEQTTATGYTDPSNESLPDNGNNTTPDSGATHRNNPSNY